MRRCTTHSLYRSKLWQQDHCQHPQNANPDGSTLEGTAQRIGRPFGRLRLWSLVWFQVRATSCHLTSSKSAWKSTPKCTWMCWRVWWSPGAFRWPVTSIQCSRLQPQSPPRYGSGTVSMLLYKRQRELGEYSKDGSDLVGFGVVGGHVGDVLDVWPSEVVQRVQVEGGGGPVREGYKVIALLLKPSLGLFGLVGQRWVLLPHPGFVTGHIKLHMLVRLQILEPWGMWLLMFYGISTLVGYLIPNPVYTYILNICDLSTNSLSVTTFKQTRVHLFAHS